MTWNTESITTEVKCRKDGDHSHSKKRYSILSRRPSVRHKVALSRSRHYSTSATLHKQSRQVEVQILPEDKAKKDMPVEVPVPTIISRNCTEQNSECTRPTDTSFQPKSSRLHMNGGPDTQIHPEPSIWLNGQSCYDKESTDIGPHISIIQDTYEDIGPKISVLQDKRDVAKLSAVEAHYSKMAWNADSSSESTSEGTSQAIEVCHCIISEEACRDRHSQSTSLEDVSGDRLCVVKTKMLRRSVSRRNKNKFSVRKQKSTIVGKLQQQPDKDKIERASTENDDGIVSLEDIKIDVQDPSEVSAHTSTDTTLQPPSTHTLTRHAHYPTKRPRRRQMRVRVCRRPRKILVLGDMTSGKTNLISAYGRDRFSETYIPTILNCFQTDAKIGSEVIDLVVVEVSGRDDFEPLRRRAYRRMDGAVICYSVDSVVNLNRIRDYWVPELRKYAPKAPFVLVGTKKDIRDSARDRLEERLKSKAEEVRSKDEMMADRLQAEVKFSEDFVSEDRGKRLANSLGANSFMECSSLYRDGTREVFEGVTKIALRKTRRLRQDRRHVDSMCSIM